MPGPKEINPFTGFTALLRRLGYTEKADQLHIPDYGFQDRFKKILEEFYWNLLACDWEKLVG